MRRKNYIVVVAESSGDKLRSLLQHAAARHNNDVEENREPNDGASAAHRILLVLEPLHLRHLKFVDAVFAPSEGFGDLRNPARRKQTLLACRALLTRARVILDEERTETGRDLLTNFAAMGKDVEVMDPEQPFLSLHAQPEELESALEGDWPTEEDMAAAARALEKASIFGSAVYPPAGSNVNDRKTWLANFACYGRSGLCDALAQLLEENAHLIDRRLVRHVIKHGGDILDQAQARAVDREQDAIEAALEALVRSDVRIVTDFDLSSENDNIRSVFRALIPQVGEDDIEVVRQAESPCEVENSTSLTLDLLDSLPIRPPAASQIGKIIVAQKVVGADEAATRHDAFIGRDDFARLIGLVSAARERTKKQIDQLGGRAA